MRSAPHESDSAPTRRPFWIAAALIVAAAFFWAATNDAVYEVTSPPGFWPHVALRKTYSIAAFALVGFLADRALGPSRYRALRAALIVAAYSAAIEVAQWQHGSREGLGWNSVDVACGAVGGWIAAAAGRGVGSRRPGGLG